MLIISVGVISKFDRNLSVCDDVCYSSPWTDKYETAEENLYTEPVRSFLLSRMDQLKSEEVVYAREEYVTMVTRPHPQCVLAEVGHKRQGVVVVRETVPQDELVMECKV